MSEIPIIHPEEPISNWDDFIKWASQFFQEDQRRKRKWIFRGMSCCCWDLKSSLERAAEVYEIEFDKLQRYEKAMVREFRRRAHHYISDLPHEDDLIEWLALMQHFGAPTRILDWGYSPFVAAFFAIRNAGKNAEIAIWAIDYSLCSANLVYRRLSNSNGTACDLNARQETFRSSRAISDRLHGNKLRQAAITSFYIDNPSLGVLAVNPFRLNERLSIQQGIFLFPCDISEPFKDNIEASNAAGTLAKIELSRDLRFRKMMLSNLNRMNINSATLFPGLAGYAESQKMLFASEEILTID